MAKSNVAANVFASTAQPVQSVPANETPEQKIARLEALIAEKDAKLAAKNNGGAITFFVGDGHMTKGKDGIEKATNKGNICLYGFNSKGLPITLWPNQWLKLIDVLTGKLPITLKGKTAQDGSAISGTFAEFFDLAKGAGLLMDKDGSPLK